MMFVFILLRLLIVMVELVRLELCSWLCCVCLMVLCSVFISFGRVSCVVLWMVGIIRLLLCSVVMMFRWMVWVGWKCLLR